MANDEHLAVLKRGAEVWNAWRHENPDVVPDLSGANLKGVNLYGASLYGAIFSSADLSDACLSEANLDGAKLRNANLRGADLYDAILYDAYLHGADLSDADLSEARLQGAQLQGANLHGARLPGANLNGARIHETLFANTDLSETGGLDSCYHLGPSVIDHRTLLSSGPLPLSFLRGCGLSDWEIEVTKLYNRNLVNEQISDIARKITQIRSGQSIQDYSCFISFTEEDDELAKRLYDDLWANGVKCWRWKENAKGGQSLIGQIDKQLLLQDKVIAVCSEASLKSGPVIREIDRACQREDRLTAQGEEAEVLFPIRLDDAIFRWEHARRADLMAKFIPDFRNWRDEHDYRTAFERLLSDLRRDH